MTGAWNLLLLPTANVAVGAPPRKLSGRRRYCHRSTTVVVRIRRVEPFEAPVNPPVLRRIARHFRLDEAEEVHGVGHRIAAGNPARGRMNHQAIPGAIR